MTKRYFIGGPLDGLVENRHGLLSVLDDRPACFQFDQFYYVMVDGSVYRHDMAAGGFTYFYVEDPDLEVLFEMWRNA